MIRIELVVKPKVNVDDNGCSDDGVIDSNDYNDVSDK
jgi:hypothetical protein